jgi:hypothetical protein
MNQEVQRPTSFYASASNAKCSGSTTVGVGLANGGRFGHTLCDNGLGGYLANGYRSFHYKLTPLLTLSFHVEQGKLESSRICVHARLQ